MNQTKDETQEKKSELILESTDRPHESTGIYVRGFLKISDPETKEVLIETSN